jgi:pyruvate dehydrogenase E2 component (dihydrolipoamide acetyltransferase)
MAKEATSQSPKDSQEKKPPPEEESQKPAANPQTKEDSGPPSKSTRDAPPAGERIFASPIAKKIALERGIPLAQLKGSGPNGRIIREDVESFKGAPSSASSTVAQANDAMPADYTDIPISSIRRVIGSRLTQSKQEVPHYYLTVDIDMGRVLQIREFFNKALAEKDKEGKAASKLSVNDFIIKAVALTLAEVPEANSAWLGEVIRQYVYSLSWYFSTIQYSTL